MPMTDVATLVLMSVVLLGGVFLGIAIAVVYMRNRVIEKSPPWQTVHLNAMSPEAKFVPHAKRIPGLDCYVTITIGTPTHYERRYIVITDEFGIEALKAVLIANMPD